MTTRRLEVFSLVVAVIALLGTGAQAYFSHVQIRDLRKQFEESGPVLQVRSELQVQFSDKRPAPKNGTDAELPIVTARDFDTYDQLFLKVIVTNVGRMETTLLDGRVRIAEKAFITTAGTSEVATFCQSADTQEAVNCGNVLPLRLLPGAKCDLYFPLKQFRASFGPPVVGTGLPIMLRSTGLAAPDFTQTFTSGISVRI
ncbi:hypothetical protein [Actinokineospora sp.]|uniref:hypothetical protein n=1 Tax=Actinokineospora sp. TaxID=1872133 RepID=UPI0040379F9C